VCENGTIGISYRRSVARSSLPATIKSGSGELLEYAVMNRLILAQQGYQDVALALNSGVDEAASDRVEAWLRDEVCPVVAELTHNRSFQRTTRWSIDHLSHGANTPERRMVEDVDRALVACASELARFFRNIDSSSKVDSSSSNIQSTGNQDRTTLEYIVGRPWFDLACPEEFFHAERGLHLNTTNSDHHNAFCQRELRVPLGDYVARSMFARVEYWKAILDRLGNEIVATHSGQGKKVYRAVERIFSRRIELDRAVGKLNAACNRDPDARLREACTALTLVYAAYANQPYLDWLGAPVGCASASAPLIRSCIRRHGVIRIAKPEPNGGLRMVGERQAMLCDPTTVRQIAAALQDVTNLYEVPEDPDDLIKWAHSYARLVLVDRSPREAYWDGVSANAETFDGCETAWNLLWVLAENPTRVIDQGMLSHPGKHEIRSRRSRLSQALTNCQALDALIVNVRGQGYRLDLPSDDILLLRDNGHGRLQIVGSRVRHLPDSTSSI
jgi:hypothetical protein